MSEIAMEMSPPRIVKTPLTRSELTSIAAEQFGDMVKAVVDVERRILALGGELHSDEEAVLLDDGSSLTVSPARHAGLAAGKWKSLSLVEQLANIGSEVDRAIKAHEAGRRDRRDAAVDRGLELFDLTAADDRWRGARRREVLRAREEFCAL
ncbi:MAG: DUF5674 family protein, partial [Patescibacteria group bacterium]